MALNGLLSGYVLLRHYSLTHSLTRTQNEYANEYVLTGVRKQSTQNYGKKDAQLPQKKCTTLHVITRPYLCGPYYGLLTSIRQSVCLSLQVGSTV